MSEPTTIQKNSPESIITREEIDRLIDSQNFAEARIALIQFRKINADPASAFFVVTRFEKLRDKVPFTSCRLAILRSFTIEPAIPLLRAMAFCAGIDLNIKMGDFNVYTQEILDPKSGLYTFNPDVVILASHTADAALDIWEKFTQLNRDEVATAVSRVSDHFKQLIKTFRSNSAAHLIIHSLQTPGVAAAGILDAILPDGQRHAIESINGSIAKSARESNNVYMLDYNALIKSRGDFHFEDRKKWLSVRMPIASAELTHLAALWIKFLHPIAGKVCKAIVVDLDNTLWGGVIGEDGMAGIKLSPDHKGGAWHDVQTALLDLYHRGIILAICSKNNHADAMAAIEQHAGMVLRPHHFAATRINWTDKATNIRDIATELNIGIDAVAFLDDNPVERDWVSRNIPEVTVIDLPEDAMGFAPALRASPVFERLSLSVEDRERGRQYLEQRMRAELQQNAGTIEAFYRSLEMQVEIVSVNAQSLQRAAQLTQKTNQFNLTTRRYSEEQISEMLASPDCTVMSIRVVDRFGDNGIVGLAMTRMVGRRCEIDNFLLSCRVIGRTVETAFLATLADVAANAGATELVGQFIPTKKNPPAKDFYASHGFAKTEESESAQVWTLALQNATLKFPEWIKRIG